VDARPSDENPPFKQNKPSINRFSRSAFLEPSAFWWYGLAFLKN
jgi:hypothetical protein